jgi:hypothetical protein
MGSRGHGAGTCSLIPLRVNTYTFALKKTDRLPLQRGIKLRLGVSGIRLAFGSRTPKCSLDPGFPCADKNSHIQTSFYYL